MDANDNTQTSQQDRPSEPTISFGEWMNRLANRASDNHAGQDTDPNRVSQEAPAENSKHCAKCGSLIRPSSEGLLTPPHNSTTETMEDVRVYCMFCEYVNVLLVHFGTKNTPEPECRDR